MGKFYFAFAWDIIVNLHVCICKNKICIWSDPEVNLPICKYTPGVFAFACAIYLPRVKFAHRSIFTRVYFWRMRTGLKSDPKKYQNMIKWRKIENFIHNITFLLVLTLSVTTICTSVSNITMQNLLNYCMCTCMLYSE